ncbi:MAG: AAA family ATPase [Firmicutes bacterium]|jgi:vesicle-fusing ATPase|nr:AAA family ATPase [Bacillota bacterium]MDH7496509.1 AAA family ATPase [Bacillota bacterium]
MMKEVGVGASLAAATFLAVSGYDITPLLLVVGIAAVLWYVQAGAGLGVGRRFQVLGHDQDGPGVPRVSFSDIGGQEVAKRELMEALEFVVNADKAKALGIRPLRGILLTGPPGTGKTLLAKAAASYTGSTFLAASGSEFVEMYAGVGAQRVRQLFATARTRAAREKRGSAMIFIDEIDVLGGKRGKHTSHLEYDQTLNQLLVEMDGINPYDDVRILVIGATNRADLLDPALLRPGRFDRVVQVNLPDLEGRLHILRIYTKDKPLAEDVDLKEIAKDALGFSGAHIENLVNEAAILALRQGKNAIGAREFKEAVDKVAMGERLDRRPSREDLERIAFHEVGHALASETLRPGSVSAITVTPRGKALGYTRQSHEEDLCLYTREWLEDQLAVLLGGAVAEEIRFGVRSTGAVNDFEQALEIARRLVGSGMSPLGVVGVDDLPKQLYHETISAILKAQEGRVRQILEAAKDTLAEASVVLLEREKLDGEEFREMVRRGQRAT